MKEIALYLTEISMKDSLKLLELLNDYFKQNNLDRALLHYYTTTIHDEQGNVVAKRNLAKMLSKVRKNQIQIVIVYSTKETMIDKTELNHIKKFTNEHNIPFVSLVENSKF